MPRGVPKAGYRNRGPKNDVQPFLQAVTNVVPFETDAQIEAKLNERFEILELLSDACTEGDARAVIVSGPAGLGKSFTVEKKLAAWDPSEINHTIVKGFVRATGLYKLLYQYRNQGQVIVFDDADSIFFDDVSLNLLKAVCDTTEVRRVSWLSEGVLVDEESATRIPTSFEFQGTIIFITNMDFDRMIDAGHRLAPHLSAMVSRAHYIELAMRTKRDYIIRIKQVVKQGMLKNLTANERDDVLEFIDSHSEKLRELSLRIAIKLGQLRKQYGANWERMAKVTCCKV